VYGEGSICVEVNATQGDCLPQGGTPRCYQRRVVQAGYNRPTGLFHQRWW